MDIAYVSALAALAGSAVGGLTSGFTTWLNQRFQVRAGHIAKSFLATGIDKDFIIAASKAYAEALVVSEPKIQELISLYAMIDACAQFLHRTSWLAQKGAAGNDRRLLRTQPDSARVVRAN